MFVSSSDVTHDLCEPPCGLTCDLNYLQTIVTSISHAVGRPEFATCGETCHIWDESRNEPVKTFSWGVDSLSCVRYNPVETHVLGKVCRPAHLFVPPS